MSADQERRATISEPPHQFAHLDTAGRIETVGRLVEEQELGV